MELINNDLLVVKQSSTNNNKDLTFSSLPLSIGIAKKETDNHHNIYVVYENNEIGIRKWEKEFVDFMPALDFAQTMWLGMKAAYARRERQKQKKELEVIVDANKAWLEKIKNRERIIIEPQIDSPLKQLKESIRLLKQLPKLLSKVYKYF